MSFKHFDIIIELLGYWGVGVSLLAKMIGCLQSSHKNHRLYDCDIYFSSITFKTLENMMQDLVINQRQNKNIFKKWRDSPFNVIQTLLCLLHCSFLLSGTMVGYM